MLSRTHFVMSLLAGLVLMKSVSNPALFLVIVVVSSFIPDIDSYSSKIGKKFSSRVITAFTKHRGVIHSLFFLVLIGVILKFYSPLISLGFIIGYGIHLFGDLLTKQGLRIFYPFKFKIKGFIKTGGVAENSLFIILGVADIILISQAIFVNILNLLG